MGTVGARLDGRLKKIAYVDNILDRIGCWIAGRLRQPSKGYEPFAAVGVDVLSRVLRPGDVLLIEGGEKVSVAIKYLTQSTWSHAALYVGEALGPAPQGEAPKTLVEAVLGHGVVASPLSNYAAQNKRICRPVGLSEDDLERVIGFAVARLGMKYDMRNVIDLARYLFPTPPVPIRWRRRMIALGSGEPTRTICSTLIAQAFQSVRYPILPRIEAVPQRHSAFSHYSQREILHIRHHSLFTPRDFDLSPFFEIVKPTLVDGFDYRSLTWGADTPGDNPG